MEVIDVDSEPDPICQDEPLEEVFSIDWCPASNMFWQIENRKSALLQYLIEYGPREFPQFKKILRRLKRILAKFEGGETLNDTLVCKEKAKLSVIVNQVIVATVRINQLGLHKFFVQGIGKDLLPSLERKHHCSVETISEKPSIVLSDEIQSSPLAAFDELLNTLNPHSQKRWNAMWTEETVSLADVEEVIGDLNQQENSVESVSEEIPPITLDKKTPNNTPSEIKEPTPVGQVIGWESTCIKNTQIQICSGDLTKEVTDAILIMNIDSLELSKGGQLNKQIDRAGGPLLKKECKEIRTERGVQLPGEAVVTGSGNLPCRHIVHVITYPGKPQILDLQLGVKRGLQLADAKGLVSIALPAIGAGSMGLSLLESARVLCGSILSFLELQPQSLREIKIVLFLESMLDTYSQEMRRESVPVVTLEGYSPLSNSTMLRNNFNCLPVSQPQLSLDERVETVSKRIKENPSTKPTLFRVYGKDRKSVMNMINGMRSIFTKHCTVHRITHKMVPQVTQHHWVTLSNVASQHDVELTADTQNNAITVRGNSDDVSVVTDRIWQEITRLAEQQSDTERRKLLAQYIRWHYVILDREIAINENLSAAIEDAYNRKWDEVDLFVTDREYKVDLKSMTVLSKQSSYPPLRLSRRLVSESGTVTPTCWTPQPCFPDGGPIPVLMVNLLASEWEYQSVTDMFCRTGGQGKQIVSIERVQNLCLYKQYTTYRQEVERKNCRAGLNNQNERKLFHGTKGYNIKAINLQGFNRNFCGVNGAVYGNGVYFATTAAYSMAYAFPDTNSLKYMYLARVSVGVFAKGQKGLRVPPPLCPDVPEVLYDSVVDDVNNPKVFVVFRDFQCYPEYLITFK